MGATRVSQGDVEEIISGEDMEPAYRMAVVQGSVRLSHSRSNVKRANEYPVGFRGTLGDLEGTTVYAYAEDDDAIIELDDATFSLFDTSRTTFSGGTIGVENPTGVQVEPLNTSLIRGITDITTATGAANAAQLGLGNWRKDVDIVVDVTGSATVTVEVQNGDGNWIPFDTYAVDAPGDTIQLETTVDDVRAHVDQNLTRLEMVSKGI